MTVTRSLLICYSPELVNGEPVFISSNCDPVKASNFEPAGHSFHTTALKLSGCYVEEDSETEERVSLDDKNHGFMPSESYSSKRKKKSGTEGNKEDHYALLGLGHLRFLATEEQIRKSYREAALKHHPDKQAALLLVEETEKAKLAKKDEIENRFKAIQEAYEVLIDPVKRRVYDSTDEFDDEIPTDCAPQDFFKVFGPAFMRNAKWSVNQPAPSLGEENTPMNEVDAFYEFWYGFKSWREFPHSDEFDLEEAESRDHKRWMERQNAKLREKARKEEYARIRCLIDNAYKKDPRISKRKDEEKAEKQRKKEARYLAKKLQEEEALRIVEEEKLRKEEENKKAAAVALNQKKLKEKEKKLLQKERARLRALAAPVISNHLLDLSENDVENICMALDSEQLKILCDSAEGVDESGRCQLLKDALSKTNSNKNRQDDKNMQPDSSLDSGLKSNGLMSQKKDNPLSSYTKKERPWGKEEIDMLRKGMLKYPKGTSRRWEVISEYIGTGRSVEEILKATKTVLLQKPDSSKAFDYFLEKRKPVPSIASPLTTRLESDGVATGGIEASKEDTADVSSEFSGRIHVEDPDLDPKRESSSTSGYYCSGEQCAFSGECCNHLRPSPRCAERLPNHRSVAPQLPHHPRSPRKCLEDSQIEGYIRRTHRPPPSIQISGFLPDLRRGNGRGEGEEHFASDWERNGGVRRKNGGARRR